MSTDKIVAVNEANTTEKKNLFHRIGDKVDEFKAKHPKLCKGMKIAGEVVALAGASAVTYTVASKIKNERLESGETEDTIETEGSVE